MWFDPFKNIYAEGYVNRRLTGGTPRRWTIMAEICLTALVLLVLGIFIAQVDTLKDAIWMGVSIAIGAGFLYRLVKNYRDTAPKAEDEDAQQGGGTVR